MDDWLVTAGAAAQMLRVSSGTFKLWVRDGLLPVAEVVGSRRYFRHEDVRKLGLLIPNPERGFKRLQILGVQVGPKTPGKRKR